VRPIGLYDFHAMFESARSFAVIGNAGTVLDHENGARIDACDVVVRFNCAYTAGIEAKVGSRTDILCANIGKSLAECPSPARTLRPRCVVSFATKSPRDGDCDPVPFAAWTGDLPVLLTWAPDLIGVAQGTRTRQLTQGTYMLYTLLRLFRVERLLVTGFTMYRPIVGRPQKHVGRSFRTVGLAHDLGQEARILAALLGSFKGELQATPEVQELLGQAGGVARPESRKVRLIDRLQGWLAWRLIDAGIGLRRSLERRTSFDVESFKHSRRKAPAL
jgi:hypothetical protein